MGLERSHCCVCRFPSFYHQQAQCWLKSAVVFSLLPMNRYHVGGLHDVTQDNQRDITKSRGIRVLKWIVKFSELSLLQIHHGCPNMFNTQIQQSAVVCGFCEFTAYPMIHLTGTLQWRNNGREGVSNHQPHYCLLNRLYRRKSKKTSKLCGTGHCAGKSPVTGDSPHKWQVTRKMFPFDDVVIDTRHTVSPCIGPLFIAILLYLSNIVVTKTS